MNLLATNSLNQQDSTIFEIPKLAPANAPYEYLKILVSGELAAGDNDRRCMLQINGITSGYTSFVVMNGHAGAGEWDGNGFYLGRNGWYLDASMSCEFTLATKSLLNKVTGHGLSTFSNGNNTILGYLAHGFVLNAQSINSVKVFFTGGVFTGSVKMYAF